jgi:hypothetical protein
MKYTKFGFLFVLSISLFFGGTMYVRGAHFGALFQPGMSIEELLGGLFPPGFGFAAKDTINSTKTVSWSKSYSGKALVTHAIIAGSWWAPALWSPSVSILYKASANKVGEGTSLSVGDKITFMHLVLFLIRIRHGMVPGIGGILRTDTLFHQLVIRGYRARLVIM